MCAQHSTTRRRKLAAQAVAVAQNERVSAGGKPRTCMWGAPCVYGMTRRAFMSECSRPMRRGRLSTQRWAARALTRRTAPSTRAPTRAVAMHVRASADDARLAHPYSCGRRVCSRDAQLHQHVPPCEPWPCTREQVPAADEARPVRPRNGEQHVCAHEVAAPPAHVASRPTTACTSEGCQRRAVARASLRKHARRSRDSGQMNGAHAAAAPPHLFCSAQAHRNGVGGRDFHFDRRCPYAVRSWQRLVRTALCLQQARVVTTRSVVRRAAHERRANSRHE